MSMIPAIVLAVGAATLGQWQEVKPVKQDDARQRPDPDFDVGVVRPAYAVKRSPTVLFDEAHNNYHTTGDR
jgi:hypothetical protein